MLALGNVLNAGSARAGAKGFRLEVLLKLAETKATATGGDEAGVSLLHYAAKCAVAKWPDVRKRFEAEMLPLSDASNVKSALVVADIQVLASELCISRLYLPYISPACPLYLPDARERAGRGGARVPAARGDAQQQRPLLRGDGAVEP